MRLAFIARRRNVWPAAWLSEALDVSRSGFHAWLRRWPSARTIADEDLTRKIRASFVSSARTYCVRRVWRDILAEGPSCGLHKIERLMRANALRARTRRRGLPKDDGQRSAEGRLYVAAVIDLFSRRIVGWPMKFEVTAELAADALMMAISRRDKPDALLHHSDRGSQYTSEQFQRLMADNGVLCSMSRSGNVWDNVAMESLFS